MSELRIEYEFPIDEDSRRELVGYPEVRGPLPLYVSTFGEVRVFMDGSIVRRVDAPPDGTRTETDYIWDLVYRLGSAVADLTEKKHATVEFLDSSLFFELTSSGTSVEVALNMGPQGEHRVLATTRVPLEDLRKEMARVSDAVVSDLLRLNPRLETHELITEMRATARRLAEREL